MYLIKFADEDEKLKLFRSMHKISVRTLNDAFHILGLESTTFEVFTSKRLQYLQKKFEINIEVFIKSEEKGSEKFYLPLKKKYSTTICLLLSSMPKTSSSIIENFEIIQDRRKLFLEYVCDVTKNCKYTTDIKANFEKHRKRCKNFNSQKVFYSQKVYGVEKNVLEEMVEKNLVPWYAVDYKCDFIATFDCETIEMDICGPEKNFGITNQAFLKLLSIAVGTNVDELGPKCWIRKTSEPDEEMAIG